MEVRRRRAPRIASCATALLLGASLHAALAHAQASACAAIADDRERLACYDALARGSAPAHAAPAVPHEPESPQASTSSGEAAPGATPDAVAGSSLATELERRWDLRPDLKRGVLTLAPYRPLYALAHATDRTNPAPTSPTRGAAADDVHLNHVDAKLQLSFRSKLLQDIFTTPADLWFGYTQQSYWQVGNVKYSSPFRETDYEPEAILVYPLQLEAGGVHARYVSVSLTHQSNGRGAALSRSWNRAIGDLALEGGPWSVHVRPWWRVFDASGEQDDNPDIEGYIGRGELVAAYRAHGHVVTLTGRHTLRGGDRSRGSARVDWAFPLAGALHGHVQIFSGYGENLIDYNQRQTTMGLGVSFAD